MPPNFPPELTPAEREFWLSHPNPSLRDLQAFRQGGHQFAPWMESIQPTPTNLPLMGAMPYSFGSELPGKWMHPKTIADLSAKGELIFRRAQLEEWADAIDLGHLPPSAQEKLQLQESDLQAILTGPTGQMADEHELEKAIIARAPWAEQGVVVLTHDDLPDPDNPETWEEVILALAPKDAQLMELGRGMVIADDPTKLQLVAYCIENDWYSAPAPEAEASAVSSGVTEAEPSEAGGTTGGRRKSSKSKKGKGKSRKGAGKRKRSVSKERKWIGPMRAKIAERRKADPQYWRATRMPAAKKKDVKTILYAGSAEGKVFDITRPHPKLGYPSLRSAMSTLTGYTNEWKRHMTAAQRREVDRAKDIMRSIYRDGVLLGEKRNALRAKVPLHELKAIEASQRARIDAAPTRARMAAGWLPAVVGANPNDPFDSLDEDLVGRPIGLEERRGRRMSQLDRFNPDAQTNGAQRRVVYRVNKEDVERVFPINAAGFFDDFSDFVAANGSGTVMWGFGDPGTFEVHVQAALANSFERACADSGLRCSKMSTAGRRQVGNPMLGDNDAEDDRPSDEDIFITVPAWGPTRATYLGKVIAQGEWDEVVAQVNAWMDAEQFWPNVWKVNERGAVDRLTMPSGDMANPGPQWTGARSVGMTNREREWAALGFEYAEGIEQARVIKLPNGREVRRVEGRWEAQPPNDNWWKSFDNPLDAVKFALGRATVGRRR